MAAHIVRVADGYPIFLAARSPARADWIEVLRRTRNWLGLESSWDKLCAAPVPQRKDGKPESEEMKRERIKREAIRDALSDDRVCDEESFRASVRAREARAAREEEEEQRKEYLRTTGAGVGDVVEEAKKGELEDESKAYAISTERADAIAKWILEAAPPGADGGVRRPKKTGRRGMLRKEASDLSTSTAGLEASVESLDLVD